MNDAELRKQSFDRLKYAAMLPGQLTFYDMAHAEHQKMFNSLTRIQKDVLAIKLTLSMAGEVNDEVKRVLGRMFGGAYYKGAKGREELHEYFTEECLVELGI